MAMANKTRNLLENLVREGSFKWLIGNRSPFDDEFEEMGRSPSAPWNWIQELSPIANIVVRRCSKILSVPTTELQESFNSEASDSIKHPSRYARNFLEYCCFRALALSTQITGHLADKKFRRLTYDMMVAWETPAASSQPLVNVDEDITVGVEAFCRIAPAVPIIANVIISENLFEVLVTSTGGRLHFFIYDKYLSVLERAIRKMKNQSESSLLSYVRPSRGEKILEVDGTVTTQPVLEHVGISTWPGRLILTDYAFYFEALRVVSYDKAKQYDLSDDLKQVIKPELTGPWGTRLFDRAVLYKSISLSEPVVMEFPELKGHARRDYWLAIIREILYVHRFIRKFEIKGVERDEALSKAVLGILRIQAIREISSAVPISCENLLMFNLCDQLPGGDLILETLADMSTLKELDRTNNSKDGGMHSISALEMVSNLGFVFGTNFNDSNNTGPVVGEITVGEITSLERAVKESRNNYEKVVMAQATVDGVKVDGIDTNLAVMKELLFPMSQLGNCLLSLAYWEDPLKSLIFCCGFSYIICRQWLGYAFAVILILMAVFMVLTRFCSQGKPVDEVKVLAPPAMNTMEQLLAVQNAVSQAEGFIQDGNIVLLKLRALLLSIFPQASEKCAVALISMALTLLFIPSKYLILLAFLEIFTRYAPMRKASTERWMRRLREWWFSIPAAPVVLEREKEDKKRK
ncbi:uncharacterized protein LOC107418779 isoform X1 [Ziziphus jujuba]|uniref:Uncharacterized protein LOC107418779 isoform X1 n=1 Tax=Ziziphus jujuba TaxID=326968 RepID=A0ABM3IL42_ZIZJJ|nr:uncharacterized protein LOC107418779 isoform X1 [Ziziphus jujuba]XP_048330887.2 uncharacterized protein LOC107418779 isoform X1 [Ziziphus jujuba]XP_048330888.2 uncharacterized protein LOC107418779 isoform X1 [Ziziphus jujuba]XP_048330889.2 uncharacterized protein LOC107418779 isoform X1 [Ziziphus jujuba]